MDLFYIERVTAIKRVESITKIINLPKLILIFDKDTNSGIAVI